MSVARRGESGAARPSLKAIAPAILKHYPDLNGAQRDIIGHLDGPLLVIAGPGIRQDLQHRSSRAQSHIAGQTPQLVHALDFAEKAIGHRRHPFHDFTIAMPRFSLPPILSTSARIFSVVSDTWHSSAA